MPWPRLESDTHIMSAGSARPLEDAFRIAQLDLVQWLGADYGLDPLDAYQLVTQMVESPLANVCDPNYTSVAKMPKQYLPRADPMSRGARPAQRDRRRLPRWLTRRSARPLAVQAGHAVLVVAVTGDRYGRHRRLDRGQFPAPSGQAPGRRAPRPAGRAAWCR